MRSGVSRLPGLITLLAAASACTEPDAAGSAAQVEDAGPGAGDDASMPGPPEGFSVTAPAEPEAPRFPRATCPAGWLAAEDLPEDTPADGPCVPPPRVACDGASAQLTGDETCRRIGTPCPEGDGFLDEATLRALVPGWDGAIRWVHPQGRGAACSREAPCRSVAEALRRPLGDGAILALAAGTFPSGPVEVSGFAIVGACAEGTSLSAANDVLEPALTLTGRRAAVANLTLNGSGPGVRVTNGGARLHGVVIEEVVVYGMLVDGAEARVELTDVVVRDVATDPGGRNGSGVLGQSGGSIVAERLLVERCHRLGFATSPVDADQRLTELHDVVVRGIRAPPVGDDPRALVIAFTPVTAERLLVEDVEGDGLVIRQPSGGSPAVLSDVVVRDVVDTAAGWPARGVSVADGSATFSRLGVARIGNVGIDLAVETGDATSVELTDVWVREVGDPEGVFQPTAVVLRNGVQLSGERLRIAQVAGEGLAVYGRSEAHLSDVVIEDVRALMSDERAVLGGGVRLAGGATLALDRARIARVEEAGIKVLAEGEARSRLEVTDVDVRDVEPASDMLGALGVLVQDGADVSLRRVRIQAVAGGGLVAHGAVGRTPALDVADLTVQDISPGRDGMLSVGLGLMDGAALTGRRIRVERATMVGVWMMLNEDDDPAPSLEADDLVIRETSSDPATQAWGTGLEVAWAGAVTLRRAVLESNHRAGLVARGWSEGTGTRVRLEDVVIRDTRTAPCADLPESDRRACRPQGQRGGGGHGLICQEGAETTLRGFQVTRSDVAGLLIATGCRLEGHDGRVHDNLIGVNAMDESWEADLLSDAVFIYGNATDVAARELAVPEAGRQLGELVGGEGSGSP